MAIKYKIENFMGFWNLSNTTICDRYIEYFQNNPQRHLEGKTTRGETIKKSTDLGLFPDENLSFAKEYFAELQEMVDDYIKEYPHCNSGSPWSVNDMYNIQYYKPGESFWGWHSERITCSERVNKRMLVFMTYLNDIDDGGGTEWYHQNLKVSAKKGKTIIWPVDWTFTHRGIVSPTQEKYIITGWFNYYGN